ncbi:hypothetical protein LCM20_01765 [Halobacillus litoralis]|uniref:hypothetical protein n=1 Tax=Halobacillus litoralis TaxID=45668 RepID=UPI001CD6270B|nr:hypothetical protein [Halobacillus litoralis]MCA0969314.1 hypothetical protein [Halobacillus litoralis]
MLKSSLLHFALAGVLMVSGLSDLHSLVSGEGALWLNATYLASALCASFVFFYSGIVKLKEK